MKFIKAPPQIAERIEERKTTEIILPPSGPPPVEIVREVIKTEEIAPSPSHHGDHHHSEGHSGRSKSKRKSSKRRSKSKRREDFDSSSSEEEIITRRVEESGPVHGPLTLFRNDKRKDERHIKSEIRALEREEKAMKYERERDVELRKAERIRENADKVVRPKRVDLGGIQVERNSKGKLSMVAKKGDFLT